MVSCRSHILVKLEFGDIGDWIRLLWGGEIQRNCRKTLRAREEPTTNVNHIWHWVGGQHSHYWAIPALQMLMPEGLAEFHNHTVILKQNQIRHPNYYIINTCTQEGCLIFPQMFNKLSLMDHQLSHFVYSIGLKCAILWFCCCIENFDALHILLLRFIFRDIHL